MLVFVRYMLSRFLRIPTTEKTHSCDDPMKHVNSHEYIVNFFKCVNSFSLNVFSSFANCHSLRSSLKIKIRSDSSFKLFTYIYIYKLRAILNYELITNKYCK